MSKKRQPISWAEGNNGCWNYIGRAVPRNRYPRLPLSLKRDGRQGLITITRFLWTELFGEIPNGAYVLHSCDNKLCINPEHLHLGTLQDNAREMHERGRAKPPRGSSHWNSKLTDQQALEISHNLIDSNRALARRYDVTPSAISSVRRGKGWKHIGAQPQPPRKSGSRGNAKLSLEEIVEIRLALSNGESGPALSKRYNVGKTTIYRIKTGQRAT